MNWSEKEVRLKELKKRFAEDANKFVYRTNVKALEGLEEDGTGELLCGRSDEVKNAIMGMFLPLLPPPPRPVDVVCAAPVLRSSSDAENWWQPRLPPAYSSAAKSMNHAHAAPGYALSDSDSGMCATMDMGDFQLPCEISPSSTFSDPYTPSPHQYYSLPVTSVPMSQLMPLPSTLIDPQCSPHVRSGIGDF